MLVVDLGWGGEGPLGKAKWFLAVDVGDLWGIYVTGVVSFIEELWGMDLGF